MNAQNARKQATAVLCIGNSYTNCNGLPGMVAALARAGGHETVVDIAQHGGMTLNGHAGRAATLEKINAKKWDFVVLQEQSVLPTVERSRDKLMYPAVRRLNEMIAARGGTCILFMTWGRRDGLGDTGRRDYNEMQETLERAYRTIGDELHIPVAPVGTAWRSAVASGKLDLWQSDGSHPTVQGSYLAACVLYAVMFHESPERLKFTAGLPADTALLVQSRAARTVL